MSQELTNLLIAITNVCILPLLGVLTAYIVALIKKKTTALKEASDSEIAGRYIDMLNNIISNCVAATTETYVKALKDKNMFNADAQLAALENTKLAVAECLSSEVLEVLESVIGDLNLYITNRIEAEIKKQK